LAEDKRLLLQYVMDRYANMWGTSFWNSYAARKVQARRRHRLNL
jgi:hypothetical protein